MAIQIVKKCRHCGGDIEQDDYFADWFHSGRPDTGSSTDMDCTPGKTEPTATPSLTIV